jgi:hypothetical protein
MNLIIFFSGNAGILKTEYHKILFGASRGLTDPSNKKNIDFAKKMTPNRIINIEKVNKDGTSVSYAQYSSFPS